MSNYQHKVRVAAIQAEPVWFDAAATTEKAISLIEEAAAAGAELIAFPEVFLSGYPWHIWLDSPVWGVGRFGAEFHRNSIEVDGVELAAIREVAARTGTTVVMGYSERSGASLYMSQAFIGPDGELFGNRRKLKPTHVERSVYGEGDGSDIVVYDRPFGRLGGLNCWEHYQTLTKHAMYCMDEQIHVASWPSMSFNQPGGTYTHSTGGSLTATRMYAIEGQVFTLLASQVVTEKALEFFCETDEQRRIMGFGGGFARIYGPDGSEVATPLAETEEGILHAEINLEDIAVQKYFADPVGHYSRPDVFSFGHDKQRKSVRPALTVETQPQHRQMNVDEQATID